MASTLRAAWTVAEVEADTSWIHRLSASESAELIAAVRRAGDADRPILDWRRDDFALEESLPTLAKAFHEVRDGRVEGVMLQFFEQVVVADRTPALDAPRYRDRAGLMQQCFG